MWQTKFCYAAYFYQEALLDLGSDGLPHLLPEPSLCALMDLGLAYLKTRSVWDSDAEATLSPSLEYYSSPGFQVY